MVKQNKNILVSFAACLFFYFFIKFFHPTLTHFLFHQNIDFLNFLTGSHALRSLDFYSGKMEEVLWGPLTMVTSGMIFTVFALLYLEKSDAKIFFLAVLSYLLITKFDVLFFPPYGDAIGGPFAEALWLAQNKFDFIGLYHQPGYAVGGPKVYLFSIYPAFQALLLNVIPSTKMFLLVNHLMVFGMAAGIALLFRQIALKAVNSEAAILMSACFLSLPIFQSQVEAINMEMPSVFASVLAVYYLVEKRIPQAAGWAVLAMLIKDTSVVICAAVFVIAAILFIFDPQKRGQSKVFLWGIAAALSVVARVLSKFFLNDQHASAGMIRFLAGWPSLRWSIILILFLSSVLVIVIWFGQKKEAASSLLRTYFPVTVMAMTAGIWFLLFINFYAVSPRYRLLLSPFLIFCVAYAISVILTSERLRRAVFLGFIALSFFSSYGLFYTPLVDNDHVLLERSLEYRNDFYANRLMANDIEENYSDFTVAAPFTLAQLLAFPQLGYVSKDLDVMIYGMRCTYGGIRNFAGLSGLNPSKTVWVGVTTTFDEKIAPFIQYPYGPRDQVLKEVVVGDKKVTIFMGGFAIEKMRVMLGLAQQHLAS